MPSTDEYLRPQGKAPSLFSMMQQLPAPPDDITDIADIPRTEIEFRDIEI